MKTLFLTLYVHAMLPFSVHSTLPKIVHAKLLITSSNGHKKKRTANAENVRKTVLR